ncbi:MAG: hypothetical protein EBU07_09620 [Betaproteobacteria bacterium]|jgi:hypothetical protein|nr:hypothetical protein [Betaproteobacteria bacterium]NBS45552.1 hypothetical protein [Betaproteobacteria bacterium]
MEAGRLRERYERALLLWMRSRGEAGSAAHARELADCCRRQSQVPRPGALEPLFWRDAARCLDALADAGTRGDAAPRPQLIANLSTWAFDLWRQPPQVPSGIPVSLLAALREATRSMATHAQGGATTDDSLSAEGALMRADEASLALCDVVGHLQAAQRPDPASDLLPRTRELARELLELSIALGLQPLADVMELVLCLLGADASAHATLLGEAANEARHALHRFAAGTTRDPDARVMQALFDAWQQSSLHSRR